MKRACLISSGGSWGAFAGGILERLNKNYDTVIGVSVGGLIAPFVGLKEFGLLKSLFSVINESNIFDKKWYKPYPLTKRGKLNKIPIIISLILGDKTIGTSNNLRTLISTYFTKDLFCELNNKDIEIIVGTQNYSELPSKIHYFSSLSQKYDDFCDWMWCGANFPFYTSLVKKAWEDELGNFHIGDWGDGGMSNLIGIDNIINRNYDEVDIFLLRSKIDHKYEGNKINNLLDNFSSCLSAMRNYIEFNDLYLKINELKEKNTKINIYWLPRELNDNCMLFNEDEMVNWWNEGYNNAFDESNIERF